MIKLALLRFTALAGAVTLFATTPVVAQAIEGEADNAQIYAGVAASVNDEPITIADVANRARLILLSLGVQPNEQTIIQAQQRALDGLIDETLQVQEAQQWEIEISDLEIEEELERLAAGNGMTLAQFQTDLVAQGINPVTLRQQMKADIAWQRLVGGRYGSRVRISDLQIDDRLSRLEKSMDQVQLRVSEIYLPAYTPEQMAQMEQGAWDLRRQIQEGAPFGLVARQFSAAPTASNGGDLGWMSPSQLKEELAEAIKGLTPPAISEPVITEDGVYLVSLMEQREPVKAELAGFSLAQFETSGPDAEARLDEVEAAFSSCEAVDDAADAVDGVVAVKLGALPIDQTSIVYADLFTNTEEGTLTDTLTFDGDRKVRVVVCRQIMSGAQLPSREEMESRLREQQISLLADRYLRDLKREATILRH